MNKPKTYKFRIKSPNGVWYPEKFVKKKEYGKLSQEYHYLKAKLKRLEDK